MSGTRVTSDEPRFADARTVVPFRSSVHSTLSCVIVAAPPSVAPAAAVNSWTTRAVAMSTTTSLRGPVGSRAR
ncbi:hypothetical protein ACFY8X_05370 [Streptomyces tanashiensis]|uniref:hypothetical protein n=1 Tax=Streptomyces tanashiensis TaxID=67367 RepID=UPI0036E38EEC